MTPLCRIEVTLPRVLGSRGWTVAVLSMSKQEFSRLEVLLRVQSGRLRTSDACVLIGPTTASVVSSAARAQAGGCHEPDFQMPRQTQQPSAAR
jgi:hypothetical protein